MKFDDIIAELGEFGPYQKRIYLLTCLAPLCVSMQILAGVFIQASPDHRCALPNLPNDTYASQGPWHDALVNASIPWDSDDQMYDQCKLRRVSGGPDNDTVSCDRWVYDRDPFKSTFVTDTDLVCDEKNLVTYASVILMCGMLIGSLVLGVLSDIFGRKRILLFSNVGHLISALAVPWVKTYSLFVVVRFLIAFFGTGMLLSAFVMGMELVGPRHRRFAGNAVNIFWSTGLFIQAALAYGLRDSRHLQMVISVPSAVVLLIYAALMPESARWLLQRGRTEEATKILQKVAKVNGVTLSEKTKRLETVDGEKKGRSIWHVFTSSTLLIRSLIIFFNWMVASMVYYGLSLNAGNLSGNIYLNFVLMAAAELASFLFCLFIMDITGRKLLHCSSMVVGGVACVATMFPVMYGNSELDWLTLVLSLVGKFGATAGFAVIYVFTAELFPTVVRNSTIGVCSFCARIGGILAPFVGDLGKIVGGKMEVALPLVIFGGLSVLAGLLVLFLPETSNKVLPETMEDAKKFGRSRIVYVDNSAPDGNQSVPDFDRDNTERLLERKA